MRIAFLSDIHGNEMALDAVLADVRKVGCDHVYVLGDICYRGYAPKSCLEKVREVADGVLKGNADAWIVRGVRDGEVAPEMVEVMNGERAWALYHLTAEDVDYLDKLPMTIEGLDDQNKPLWLAFHATPTDLFPAILPDAPDGVIAEHIVSERPYKFFLYGHIHIPYARTIGDQTVVNLGSVGLPFDGIPQASYVVLSVDKAKSKVDFRRVPYDIDAAVARLDAAGYPQAVYIAEILRKGRLL